MNDQEMIKIIKEVGSDITLLGDFLSRLTVFICLDNGVDKFNLEYDTNEVNCKSYHGKLKITLNKGGIDNDKI